MVTFNADGPEGLIDGKVSGRNLQAQPRAPRGAGCEHRERTDPGDPRRGALATERPDAVGLRRIRISVTKTTVSRELREMGYRKLSARPRHHAQTEPSSTTLKKLPARLERSRAKRAPAVRP